MDKALALRERFTRETDSILIQIFGNKGNQQIMDPIKSLGMGIRIIRVLSKKNPRWLLNNP